MTESDKIVNLNMTFKNLDATEPLKQYADSKITNCLRKFAHANMDAHLVLAVERNRQIAEISIRFDGANLQGKEESDDLYRSIDALVDSLTMQLRKHKEKLVKRH